MIASRYRSQRRGLKAEKQPHDNCCDVHSTQVMPFSQRERPRNKNHANNKYSPYRTKRYDDVERPSWYSRLGSTVFPCLGKVDNLVFVLPLEAEGD